MLWILVLQFQEDLISNESREGNLTLKTPGSLFISKMVQVIWLIETSFLLYSTVSFYLLSLYNRLRIYNSTPKNGIASWELVYLILF